MQEFPIFVYPGTKRYNVIFNERNRNWSFNVIQEKAYLYQPTVEYKDGTPKIINSYRSIDNKRRKDAFRALTDNEMKRDPLKQNFSLVYGDTSFTLTSIGGSRTGDSIRLFFMNMKDGKCELYPITSEYIMTEDKDKLNLDEVEKKRREDNSTKVNKLLPSSIENIIKNAEEREKRENERIAEERDRRKQEDAPLDLNRSDDEPMDSKRRQSDDDDDKAVSISDFSSDVLSGDEEEDKATVHEQPQVISLTEHIGIEFVKADTIRDYIMTMGRVRLREIKTRFADQFDGGIKEKNFKNTLNKVAKQDPKNQSYIILR